MCPIQCNKQMDGYSLLLQNNTPPVPREQSAFPAPAENWELPMQTGSRNPINASCPKNMTYFN